VLVQSVVWKRIPNTVRESVSYFKRADGDASAWGKAVATVDTSAARALAYNWCGASYEHVEGYIKQQGAGALRKVIYEDDSHTMLYVNFIRLGGVLASRIFATTFSWREEDDGSFFVAWAPVEEHSSPERVAQADELIRSDAAAAQATRATTRGFFRVNALAPSVCQVAYVVQANLGGSIPKAVTASRVKRTLGTVQKMQAKYERKGAVVDAEMRSAFPLQPQIEQLGAGQKQVMESCRSIAAEQDWAPLAYNSPFVDMWIAYTPPKRGERSFATGKAETLVDSSAAKALAWAFAFNSRERVRVSSEQGHPARLTTAETTPHDIVVATIKSFPFPLTNREFVCRLVVAEDSGTLLLATESVSDVVDYGTKNKVSRGSRAAQLTTSGQRQNAQLRASSPIKC